MVLPSKTEPYMCSKIVTMRQRLKLTWAYREMSSAEDWSIHVFKECDYETKAYACRCVSGISVSKRNSVNIPVFSCQSCGETVNVKRLRDTSGRETSPNSTSWPDWSMHIPASLSRSRNVLAKCRFVNCAFCARHTDPTDSQDANTCHKFCARLFVPPPFLLDYPLPHPSWLDPGSALCTLSTSLAWVPNWMKLYSTPPTTTTILLIMDRSYRVQIFFCNKKQQQQNYASTHHSRTYT